MLHFKKMFALCLPALLLAGCVHQPDTTVTWQATLPTTGAAVSVYGAEVEESSTPFYDADGNLLTETATYLLANDRAGVMVGDVGENGSCVLHFAQPHEDGYGVYSAVDPVPRVDFFSATPESGGIDYHLDTYYNYVITVTTAAGTDYLVVTCAEK